MQFFKLVFICAKRLIQNGEIVQNHGFCTKRRLGMDFLGRLRYNEKVLNGALYWLWSGHDLVSKANVMTTFIHIYLMFRGPGHRYKFIGGI